MPYTKNEEFHARLTGGKTVWSAGAYDALSARFIEAAGFDACMTSGFGVSASHLGMPDAELYTMSENLAVVRNVVAATGLPIVADIDTAYGNAINVMRTIREFENAGVAAVIMEDQVAPKRCPICVGGVETISVEEAEGKIAAAVEARRNKNMVIIARTDAATEGSDGARQALCRRRCRHHPADLQDLQDAGGAEGDASGRRRAAVAADARLAGAGPLAPGRRGCGGHGDLRARAADDGGQGAGGEPRRAGEDQDHKACRGRWPSTTRSSRRSDSPRSSGCS